MNDFTPPFHTSLCSPIKVAFDVMEPSCATSRFALVHNFAIAGGGTILSACNLAERRRLTRSANITPIHGGVTLENRWQANGHKSAIFWLTGLPCSGKSTLAIECERMLFEEGFQVALLDGDNLRNSLNADLGFTMEERAENIRRAGEVAILLAELGLIVIAAFISPFRADRDRIRSRCPALFREIYLSADLATCEARDVKGLYRRARAGQIENFTGVSAPYEPPESPELTIDTAALTLSRSANLLAHYALGHLKLAGGLIDAVPPARNTQ